MNSEFNSRTGEEAAGTEHLFLIWSICANVLAYGGCIAQSKSDRRIWKILTICGQTLGVIGLFLILGYLLI